MGELVKKVNGLQSQIFLFSPNYFSRSPTQREKAKSAYRGNTIVNVLSYLSILNF